MKKHRVLFLLRHEYQNLWEDGLFKALELLSYDYNINVANLLEGRPIDPNQYDFALGWGAFGSPVDRYIKTLDIPKGLCIAGNAHPPVEIEKYDVLFYETDWYKPRIESHPNIVKAFGINTDIYTKKNRRQVWDYITVGAFALWKRQHLLLDKEGYKLAVGEIQKGNPQESLGIVARLLAGGVFVSDMVPPKKLAELYNMSGKAYIPCDINGGGERAVLEARSCGLEVEIEKDNPKLAELLNGPIYDHNDYYKQLKKGLQECLV